MIRLAGLELIDEVERGGKKPTGRTMLYQQCLHFKVGRVKQVVKRGVVVRVFVVDIHAVGEQSGRNLFIGDNQVRFVGIARTEDRPVQCGPSKRVRRFYIRAAVDQGLGLREIVQCRLLFGLTRRGIKYLDEFGGV